jgi:hypothetical protein
MQNKANKIASIESVTQCTRPFAAKYMPQTLNTHAQAEFAARAFTARPTPTHGMRALVLLINNDYI